MSEKEKFDFDEWADKRIAEMFQVEKFKEMGKDKDFVFQALVFAGEGSQKLSFATTVLSDVEKVPEELKVELKSIQQQLHDFKEKLRNF